MNNLAEIQFKRIMVKRWIGVLNKVQLLKDDIKKIQYIGEFSTEQKSRISGISNYRSSYDSLPPRAVKPPTHSQTSLNINELNNSEDLQQAHDLMSQHLQQLMSKNIESQEIETLKQLISDIKHKYQLSRMSQNTENIHIIENNTPLFLNTPNQL